MNVETSGQIVRVTLSRRNLEHLLQMLDHNVGSPSLKRRVENDTYLYVVAEENESHYLGREAGPGAELPKAA